MPEEICFVCGRNSAVTPLLKLKYRGNEIWICAQDLPVLIHKPAQLADKLPGLEELDPAEHEH
jgi:hypothetical protein